MSIKSFKSSRKWYFSWIFWLSNIRKKVFIYLNIWVLYKKCEINALNFTSKVTGHSLGGSLASLGAGLLVKKYKVDDKKMKLVTFAAPRTGNSEWAKAMDQIVRFSNIFWEFNKLGYMVISNVIKIRM